MLKKTALLFCFLIFLSLCSCGTPKGDTNTGCTVAMIGRRDAIEDGRYNEYITSGISAYCKGRGISYNSYIPTDDNEISRINSAVKAINDGAKVIIAAGSGFSVPFYNLQVEYPSVYFVLFDACVHSADTFSGDESYLTGNTVCISFRNEDIGFLAGCSAVISDCKNPAFVGGINNESERAFCYGFLQGLDYAAGAAGIDKGDLKVRVSFSDNYLDKDSNSSYAKSLIENGTDCIFASDRSIISYISKTVSSKVNFICGGFNYYNDKGHASICIGERIDRIVPKVLENIFENDFSKYSGKNLILGIKNNAIGLIEDSSADVLMTVEGLEPFVSEIKNNNIALKSEIDMVSNLGVFTAEELYDNLGLIHLTVDVEE